MKQGWVKVKLDDIAELVTKGTTPTSLGHSFVDKGINFIKVESVSSTGSFIPEKFAYINDDCHQSLNRSQLKVNDILFSIAGALGRIAVVSEDILPANTNQALAIIRLNKDKEVHPEYLANYFKSPLIIKQIEELRAGAAQQNLSLGQLKQLDIIIPPLEEQKRIVAVLDEAFEGLETACANAEANLKNAEELPRSFAKSLYHSEKYQCSDVKLGDFADITMGQSPPGTSYNTTGDGVPLINGPVEFGGTNPFSQTINIKYTTSPAKMCAEGDLILCVRGSTTGRMNIAANNACIGRGVAAIRAKVNQSWLNNIISLMQKDILELGRGATFPNVSQSDLKKLVIPMPSNDKMDQAISGIDSTRVASNNAQLNYDKNIKELSNLRQSLLQKAFAGELT